MHRIENPTEVDTVTAWMADGNCRNYPPAVFFPSDGVGVDRARKICTDCPVARLCLEYALEERIEHGVWGGCSERERITGAHPVEQRPEEPARGRGQLEAQADCILLEVTLP